MSEVGLAGFLSPLVLESDAELVLTLLDAQLVGIDRRCWVPFLLLPLGWLDGVLEEEEGRGREDIFFTGFFLVGEEEGEWKEWREGIFLCRRLGRGREDVCVPGSLLVPGWLLGVEMPSFAP